MDASIEVVAVKVSVGVAVGVFVPVSCFVTANRILFWHSDLWKNMLLTMFYCSLSAVSLHEKKFPTICGCLDCNSSCLSFHRCRSWSFCCSVWLFHCKVRTCLASRLLEKFWNTPSLSVVLAFIRLHEKQKILLFVDSSIVVAVWVPIGVVPGVFVVVSGFFTVNKELVWHLDVWKNSGTHQALV